MKIGSGAVLIVFALFVLYIGVSGKYDCFSGFFSCLFPGRSLQLGGAGVASGSSIPGVKAGGSTGSGGVGSISVGPIFGGAQAGGTPSTFPLPGGSGSGGCFLPGCASSGGIGGGNPFGTDFGDFSF